MRQHLTAISSCDHLLDTRVGLPPVEGKVMAKQSLPADAVDDVLHLVDLQRYPIHDLESEAGHGFLAQCQAHMAAHGWCSLDGFIRPEAVALLAREASGLLPEAESLTIKRNIYGGKADASANPGDPRRREIEHRALQLADDQIPDRTLIKRLYHCNAVTEFVRQVEGKSQLFRSADEFQALNIVALPPGAWHGWHYDHDECVVTLLLQAADQGGEFTFLPDCRTRESEDTETVERFLAGDRSLAKTFPRDAGTFTLFRGEFSLHGVTKVLGSRPRITAIFTYDEQADRRASDEINLRIYGPRAERILAERRAR